MPAARLTRGRWEIPSSCDDRVLPLGDITVAFTWVIPKCGGDGVEVFRNHDSRMQVRNPMLETTVLGGGRAREQDQDILVRWSELRLTVIEWYELKSAILNVRRGGIRSEVMLGPLSVGGFADVVW